MLRVGIGIQGVHEWFGGDLGPVLDLVREADALGIDQVSLSDHVVMSENLDPYPYGKFRLPLDFAWHEPLTVLAAIAAVTKRIRLSTNVLIAPLRPAVLLAKQLATLDVLSRGRVEVAFGVGWQKEEYEASGVPFERRLTRLEEQARVCRTLWSGGPASFHGETVSFDRLYSRPFPVQGRNLPIWWGVAPTPRNAARIAELGDGWAPIVVEPAQIAEGVATIRAAFAERGRDFAGFQVRAVPKPARRADRSIDLEATLAQVPAMAAAGVTVVELPLTLFCSGLAGARGVLERVVAVRG